MHSGLVIFKGLSIGIKKVLKIRDRSRNNKTMKNVNLSFFLNRDCIVGATYFVISEIKNRRK